MAGKDKVPVTPAIRVLREHQVEFEPLLFRYQERGGTAHSAAELGWEEHAVIKTLVLIAEERVPILMLMHGDREVSLRNLARHLGYASLRTATATEAQKQTGYLFGGTSPFGTKKELPVYAPASIARLPRIAINGGKRGFLVAIAPEELARVLELQWVEAPIEHRFETR